MAVREVIAVDLGNESGRLFACQYDGRQITGVERVRFANIPVLLNGTLHWDILRLWGEIDSGLKQVLNADSVTQIAGIGVCSFGVDFGLIDEQGSLISNPVHMRDSRTQGKREQLARLMPDLNLYQRTGIAPNVINTLYQLIALRDSGSWQLETARALLTIPNLLNYWMTGERYSEYTHATTTQMVGAHSRDWDIDLLDLLDLPVDIYPSIVQPGTRIGLYQNTPVLSVASHDTASAVLAIPAETNNFAYISSGTWSLVGVETDTPILTAEALQAGITNEGGAFSTYRPLNLVMGLWLLQGCRAALVNKDGEQYTYAQLLHTIEDVPEHQYLIDPDDPSFFAPSDMVKAIQAYCQRTGQAVPPTTGAIIRCVMESLALKYRVVIQNLARITGKSIEVVHIVGGGSQNAALCQMTANALNLPVLAGPVEAAALGNGVMQLVALGELDTLAQVRTLMRDSCGRLVYTPDAAARGQWDAAADRFDQMLVKSS